MAEWEDYTDAELGFMELKTVFNRVYMSYVPLSRLLAGPGVLRVNKTMRYKLKNSGVVVLMGSVHGGNNYYGLTEYGSWVLSMVRGWGWRG